MDRLTLQGKDSKPRLKVIYIAGAGRSGSTLLDCLLGQVPTFHSTGELHSLFTRDDPYGGTCGCQLPLRDCTLWSSAIESLNPKALADASAAFKSASRTRNYLLPGLSRFKRQERETYASTIEDLYLAVARQAKAKVLIDSSKIPGLAGLQPLMRQIDMYVVHLVRDPRAVAFSWQRQKTRPTFLKEAAKKRTYSAASSSTRWVASNMAAEWIGKSLYSKKRLRIRYEDLTSDPNRELQNIQSLVNAEPVDVVQANNVANLSVTHTAGGNLSRFNLGEVKLCPDVEWQMKLPRRDKVTCMILSVLLFHRYHYRIRS